LNQQRIIECLLSGPATQAELARQTGLSTATVSNIVKIMQDSGLASTEPTTSSGRRALSVRLNSNGAVAVGIDFGRRHLRVVLASLSYEIIAEESVLLPLGHHADQGIEAAVALLARLLDGSGVERSAIVGAGVGIPGPVDRRTGTVAQGAILPEWVGINILGSLLLPAHGAQLCGHRVALHESHRDSSGAVGKTLPHRQRGALSHVP
jgi:DNA-binding MarR family transcriptional regulator